MQINNVDIEVEYKAIKNVHLAVYPPNGRVHISVPHGYSEDKIRMYILQKWVWIEEKRDELSSYEIQSEREYVSGEAHFFRGQNYRLYVACDNSSPHFAEIKGDYIVLHVHNGTTKERLKEVLYEWYKQQLKELLTTFIAKWEKELGVKLDIWEIRKMDARWGTCSQAKKKAIFNVELAKKPTQCVEYIVLHELSHLTERNHTDRFKRILDTHLPNWEEIKKQLNEFPL